MSVRPSHASRPRRAPLLEPLEPRLLLSATPLPPAAGVEPALVEPVVVVQAASDDAAPATPPPVETAAAAPAFTVTAPGDGAWVSAGTVVVEFAAQDFALGGPGESHLNFYLDADPTPYVFLNGATREVLHGGVHTHAVHWRSETSVELHGLPAGPHAIRFVLADAAGQELTNPEATRTLALTVAEPPAGAFALTPVFTGLAFPVSFAFAPDGRVFYNELATGRIRVIGTDGQVAATPFAQLDIAVSNEAGLIGLALDPAFATNHFVYAYHSYEDGAAIRNRVLRLTDAGGLGVDPTILLDAIPGWNFHNAGILAFGPDGTLYITAGDAGQQANAQSAASLSGKVLRINPDGTIPADNPIAGSPVYALGLRNSFGLGFHPHTGDLWLTENGPAQDDEINRIVAGGNYGWPNVTGIVPGSGFIDPLVEFTPTIAPTGIVALGDASAYPAEYLDDLVFGDFNTGRLRRIVLTGPALDTLERAETIFPGGPAGGILDLELGPDGFVYASTAGAIHRLTLAPAGSVQLIGVQVTGVTETTATIEWTTDVAADSQVEYGPTTDYGLLTPPDPALTTVHSVTVGGLEPGATYHFRARSRPAGQAPAASQDFTVTTAVPTGTLAGVAFDDLDGDGVREAGEPGLAGWTIVLDLHDDATVDATTVTDAAGAYAFAGVAAGTHAVREAPQAGWTQTAPPAAATAATALTASAAALFTPAEAVGDGLAPMAASVAGEGLTNLAAFRADPRFAGIDGRGMAAVVIDTGIDVDHPFFGPDGDGDGVADRIVFQYDFADRDADASDRDGHGSSMASILASQDASVGGIAPAVDLIVLKVFADATRQASFAYLEQALQWVIAHVDTYDIAVVNLSLGDGGNWSTAAPRYGIDDELAALADHDIVVAAPAGNGFYTAAGVPGVAYPAADPNALAIGAVWAGDFGGPWTSSGGATDLTTGPDRIASFSQRHATLTDVFAPGARLVGANQAGGTVTLQGTSQATAYVSGATVLAQQVAEQALGRRLTVAEVTDLLRRTGDPIVDGDDENDNVTNTGLTFARLDVLALADGILALDAVDPDPSAEPGATAAPHVVTLAPGQARGDVDFGNFRLAEIRGSVFHDLDLDGTPAAAEPSLAGWTVFLDANANGQRDPLESVSVTDGQGRYAFTGVGPGRVRTVQVVPPLWAPTAAPAPGEIVVTSGLVVTGRDFGAVRITLDVDGNGTAEALTDGRVLYRLLSGVDDARLVAGSVIAPGAVRPAPATIRAYVDAAASLTPSMPDADGDGAATIADATIILRYLAGAPPAQLLTGLTLGAGATRTTAAAIVDHLDDFLPAAAVPADATGAAAPIATVTETPDGAAASADAPTEDPSAEAPVWHAVRMEGAPALSRSIVEPGVVVAPPALRAQRGPDLVVDWSRSWEGWRHRRDPGTRREPSWVAPLLLDLQEEDPNRALQVVLADRYPNSIPA